MLIRRILLSCLPGIGDALFTLPVIRALKESLPEVTVDALTMYSGAAELLGRSHWVDEVFCWDFTAASKWDSLRFVLSLRRRGYDVFMHGYPANRLEYNLIALLTGSRTRAGHRYRHADWRCGNWLHTHAVYEDDHITNVEENLRLVSLLTGAVVTPTEFALPFSDEELRWAKEWTGAHDCRDAVLIGFHPGGSTNKNHAHKRWQAEYYGELGRILVRETGAKILLFGGPSEDVLKERIVEMIGPSATSVQAPSILHTAAVMRHCRYFVANDNALLHVARVLRVPATGVFGPTHPEWVRMTGAETDEATLGLPCQPCFYYSPRHLRCASGDFRCMTGLTPDIVARQVLHRMCSLNGEVGRLVVGSTES